MKSPFPHYVGKFIFFVWAFAAVVGILTTGKFLVFGLGAFMWLAYNVVVLGIIVLMLTALRKNEGNEFLRFVSGVMAGITAFLLMLTYFFIDRDLYAPIATQSNQLLALFGFALATVVYSFWNNDLVRPMRLGELKDMFRDDPNDPTKIDYGFNERVFGIKPAGGNRSVRR